MSKHRQKGQNTFGHYALSFLLFLMIAVLSLSICFRAYILNPNTYANIFTDKEYVSSLQNDIKQFAKDECAKCSIPDTFVDDVISYDLVYNIESSYIHSALGTSNAYSDDAFENNLESLQTKIKDTVDTTLEKNGLSSSIKSGSTTFAQRIADYTKQKSEFVYIDKLQTVLNVTNVVLIATIIVSAIFAIMFGALCFFKHEKRYRSLRLIAYAFEAGALFDFVMVGAVGVVRLTKDLVVYPTYLCDALMRFVGTSMVVVSLTGFVLLFISLLFTTAIWCIKRGKD